MAQIKDHALPLLNVRRPVLRKITHQTPPVPIPQSSAMLLWNLCITSCKAGNIFPNKDPGIVVSMQNRRWKSPMQMPRESMYRSFMVQWKTGYPYHICWLPDSTTLSDRLIKSWARQRFVAASSRRTEEKVASRRGSGRHCRRASRARALSLSLLSCQFQLLHGDRRLPYRRKQRTTCFSSLAVCCSTNCDTMLLNTVPTA